VIRLGTIELEFVPERAGDEGWSDHWAVYERRGKRRKLYGYAVSPEGAAMLVATLAASTSERKAALKAARDWRAWVNEIAEFLRGAVS